MPEIYTDADVPPPPPFGPAPLVPAIEVLRQDPRTLTLPRGGHNGTIITVKPDVYPKPLESQFVIVYEYRGDDSFKAFGWDDVAFRNKPGVMHRHWGGGVGYGALTSRPCLKALLKRRAAAPDIIYLDVYGMLVSPRTLEALREFGVPNLETLAVDFTPNTSEAMLGHVLLDVRRVVDAYDYARSEVWFTAKDDRLAGGRLGRIRAFRDDLPDDLHFFHDLYDREPTIMSRQLMRFLLARKLTGLTCKDPATNYDAAYGEELAAREEKMRRGEPVDDEPDDEIDDADWVEEDEDDEDSDGGSADTSGGKS